MYPRTGPVPPAHQQETRGRRACELNGRDNRLPPPILRASAGVRSTAARSAKPSISIVRNRSKEKDHAQKNQVYVGEFNRCRGDNIRRCARRLNRQGLPTSVIQHKTSLRIVRPADMSWLDFTRAVRGELNPHIGAILIHSRSTGNTFVCRNRGNRPGRFQRL